MLTIAVKTYCHPNGRANAYLNVGFIIFFFRRRTCLGGIWCHALFILVFISWNCCNDGWLNETAGTPQLSILFC